MKNKFLMSVAALAIVSGTNLALAQVEKGQKSAPAPQQSGMSGSAKMDQGAQAPKTKQSAQFEQAGKGSKLGQPSKMDYGNKISQGAKVGQDANKGKSAQDTNARTPSKNMAQERNKERNRISAEEQRRAGSKTTIGEDSKRGERGKESAEDRNRTGNGATAEEHNERAKVGESEQGGRGADVKLSADQRTKIKNMVVNERGAPRIAHADFDVRVGTVIPREQVHAVPLPSNIVRIEPEWRGYLYFLVGDEVVVVEPHTMRIVAVLEA